MALDDGGCVTLFVNNMMLSVVAFNGAIRNLNR